MLIRDVLLSKAKKSLPKKVDVHFDTPTSNKYSTSGHIKQATPYFITLKRYFLCCSTHLRALTNASIHGVISSLPLRSVG